MYPTDTVYGMGCRMDQPNSVKRLFTLRRRPETKAVPVLIDTISLAEKYYTSPLPNNVRHLMKTYWPGPLTIIYWCKQDLVPSLVRGGGKTVGMRQPDHPIPLALIKRVGIPLLGPSANFHGQKTPYSFQDLDHELLAKVDYVLEGECTYKMASTVVNCTRNPFFIERQGYITFPKH